MQGIKIGLLVTRIWLLICACVVLGTSAHLTSVTKAICDYINGDGGYCDESYLLAPLRYCIFVGVWGVVQVLVGLAGVFAAAVPWIAVIVVDALALIFYLAGGIALAVWMHNIGGCRAGAICGELKADIAFLFLSLSGYIVAVVLVFVWQRRRQARE